MGKLSGHLRFSWLRKRYLFNIYLLLGSISIVVATTIFTIRVSKSVERQSYLTTELFSNLASRLLLAVDVDEVEPVIAIINEIEVPFIITDNSGRPFLWNEPVIGIPVPSFEQLLLVNPSSPTNPAVAEILTMAAAFDQEQEPFAIVSPAGQRLGTLHYGQSALSMRIRYMPYLELMIMALFFLVIVWALQGRKDAEQKALFAGMAKETAHQLGTPLTSIMGWVALLEEKVGSDDDVIIELHQDVNRLSRISARFSQIGSRPKLEDTDFTGLVDEGIEYFRRRLPQMGGRVQLRREGDVSNPVRFNRDLMGWVIENLIKNGIDALIDGKGTITIKLSDRSQGGALMLVSDTGRGIPARVGKKVFEPGFTTKKRGWGMGLALVKRIVVQYHGGRINIASTSRHGTTFQVLLPSAGDLAGADEISPYSDQRS
ncbi:MAG: HAMP domain-containing histidine kinase [Gemmatimonadales bacterium]|nr:HAMP domain-containing histidine kinase [Gemmatimonadales bacterium]